MCFAAKNSVVPLRKAAVRIGSGVSVSRPEGDTRPTQRTHCRIGPVYIWVASPAPREPYGSGIVIKLACECIVGPLGFQNTGEWTTIPEKSTEMIIIDDMSVFHLQAKVLLELHTRTGQKHTAPPVSYQTAHPHFLVGDMAYHIAGLHIMYKLTVAGAGAFGAVHLLAPSLFSMFPGFAVGTPYAFSDMFIGSAFGGFAICSALALKSKDPDAWWPIMQMQKVRIALWRHAEACVSPSAHRAHSRPA